MNRLVIIGNGFDLAHGLPTGYCDFINWYWKNLFVKIQDLRSSTPSNYEDDFIIVNFKFEAKREEDEFTIIDKDISELSDYDSLKKFISKYKSYKKRSNGRYTEYSNECSVSFKSLFFQKICTKQSVQNWVDIENEYYSMLKDSLDKINGNFVVQKLNQDFEQVKKLLEKYLTAEIEEKYSLYTNHRINELIVKRKYENEDIDGLFREISSVDVQNVENAVANSITGNGYPYRMLYINNIYYLNFNYTSLIEKFASKHNNRITFNQIHGKLEDKSNPINFGFGDEMDDDYKTIEKKDDNEYLKNIKSFAYLNTPNYKSLIDFLESDKFQVYIMGHSCGLSDRILLNKVFEHKNCISIKIYYFKNGDYDNYTDIAQNVSRHFNKKEMMRERIVNKTFCEPLPQTKLQLKDA